MKLLTVSIAAYNAERFLRRCLDSFADSEILSEIEVIIVDDGSTDDTLQIAKEYEQKSPGTFVAVHKENGGHGSTINTSIGLATGQYFKIVDADDWVETSALVRLVRSISRIDADIILMPYKTVVEGTDESRQVLPFNKSIPDDMSDVEMPLQKISKYLTLPMHGMTFKTSLLKNSKYRISEHCFYVDSEYTTYYLKDVKTVYYIPETLYCYRIGANEQSISFQSMQKRRKEHERVCINVLKYYLSESDNLSTACKEVIFRRLADLLNAEYKILLTLPEKDMSKIELNAFFENLQQCSRELFLSLLHVGCKSGYSYTKAASVVYHSRFIFFNVVHWFCLKNMQHSNMEIR